MGLAEFFTDDCVTYGHQDLRSLISVRRDGRREMGGEMASLSFLVPRGVYVGIGKAD